MSPQRITVGLKTNFNLSRSYSFHKSLFHTSHFSNNSSDSIHNFGTQTEKNNNTCLGAYLYPAGPQDGNLHQSSVTKSRVTYFILRVHKGTGVNHSQHMKTSGDVSGKTNAGEWIGRVEIAKEEISGSKRSMNGHKLTYSNF